MAEELIGLIGGTGLGEALIEKIKDVKFHSVDTPFGRPSDMILVGKMGKIRVAFINRHGRGHKLSPSEVPYAANIFALKKLGAHAVIATGAVGSLRQSIRPGDLVIVSQFIDKTFRRQGSFFAGYGAVHCEMSEPVCGRLSRIIGTTATKLDVRTHRGGTYVCMEGPQFSTRAESLMHKGWGGDLIGMTAMPEAKLAREAQVCYALIAIVSDYDCWRIRPFEHTQGGQAHRGRPQRRKDKQELLREIIGNMQRASENCLKLIEATLAGRHGLAREDCGCRRSLDLAVWTNQKEITAGERKKVAVLFE